MRSIEERIFALNNATLHYQEFCTLWRERFQTDCPNRKYRQRLVKKFNTTGSVHDRKRSGRPRAARTENNIIHTITSFAEKNLSLHIDLSSDRTTVAVIADQLNICNQSVRNILKKDLKWRSKVARKVQMLTPYDIFRRAMFCRAMRRRLAVDPHFLDMVVWTDEALFALNGTVRTSFIRYWTDDTRKVHCRRRETQGVMVSVGIWRYGLLGPYFFEDLPLLDKPPEPKPTSSRRTVKKKVEKDKIDSKKFVQLMKMCYLPEILKQFPTNDQSVRSRIWFQLDGTPIHTAKRTKYLLNLHFPGRWMGNLGPIHWPPYSPDLTPLDFSF